jgi:hypothetical protein
VNNGYSDCSKFKRYQQHCGITFLYGQVFSFNSKTHEINIINNQSNCGLSEVEQKAADLIIDELVKSRKIVTPAPLCVWDKLHQESITA